MEEVEGPPDSPSPDDEEVYRDLSHRCWFDQREQVWMTDFPPPAGFTGYESCDFNDLEDPDPYCRNCTEEEAAILDADREIERAAERAEEEELRDAWFDLLRTECSEADARQRPSSTKCCAEPASGSPSGDPD